MRNSAARSAATCRPCRMARSASAAPGSIGFGYQIFNGHARSRDLKRPKPVDGVEQLLPRGARRFLAVHGQARRRARALRQSAARGSAMRATRSARISSSSTLREKGLLPAGVRFQISIPMVNSVVRPLYFPDPARCRRAARLRGGARRRARRHRRSKFRAEDLAIQWDCAWEIQAVCGAGKRRPKVKSRPIRRRSRGYRSTCPTTSRSASISVSARSAAGRPSRPTTWAKPVDLINAAIARPAAASTGFTSRRSTRTDDAFYAPLAALEPKARAFISAPSTPWRRSRARIAVARKFLPASASPPIAASAARRPKQHRAS